jgi:hypothetical protein
MIEWTLAKKESSSNFHNELSTSQKFMHPNFQPIKWMSTNVFHRVELFCYIHGSLK